MPTNAMGRDSQRPGNNGQTAGGRGTNADKDRAARASMGAAMAGAGRPDRNALNLDTITPNYSWDDAQISDFGISGGIMNALKGIAAGNTYAGRTPLGFTGGKAMGNGGLGEKYNPLRQGQFPAGWPIDRIQKALGTTPPAPMQLPPGPMAPPKLNPFQMGPQNLSVPGGSSYGVNIPGFSYFK
jgi:hypothetical protein